MDILRGRHLDEFMVVTALTVVHDVEVVPRLAGLSIDKGMPNGSVRTSPTAGLQTYPQSPLPASNTLQVPRSFLLGPAMD
jgi:hypothetical protein